ncbi:MAG: type II toxin-antitoxin system VapC family toxin [Polyangiaceae bacterium]
MKPILIDTGVIVALLDRSERKHAACVEAVTALEAPLVTCEAVIAEACYLLRDLRGASDAVLANVDRGVFQVPFRLADASSAIRALMKRYASVPMDFADACLVHMADMLETASILTLDSDFDVYRWRRRRPFDLLV